MGASAPIHPEATSVLVLVDTRLSTKPPRASTSTSAKLSTEDVPLTKCASTRKVRAHVLLSRPSQPRRTATLATYLLSLPTARTGLLALTLETTSSHVHVQPASQERGVKQRLRSTLDVQQPDVGQMRSATKQLVNASRLMHAPPILVRTMELAFGELAYSHVHVVLDSTALDAKSTLTRVLAIHARTAVHVPTQSAVTHALVQSTTMETTARPNSTPALLSLVRTARLAHLLVLDTAVLVPRDSTARDAKSTTTRAPLVLVRMAAHAQTR